jgi:hypothetical protein
VLLRARGFKNAYTLKGGLDRWKEDVLFPALPDNAPPQQRARFERAAALARFFGGSPRTEGAQPAALIPELPKIEGPALAGAGAPVAPRKKKEGC